jgi:hypothetical protein
MAPNGARFGGWLLGTTVNQFGPAGDFNGDGADEVFVTSPWGIGILKLLSWPEELSTTARHRRMSRIHDSLRRLRQMKPEAVKPARATLSSK